MDGMGGGVGRLWPEGRRRRGNGGKSFKETGNVRSKVRGKGNGRSGNGREYRGNRRRRRRRKRGMGKWKTHTA